MMIDFTPREVNTIFPAGEGSKKRADAAGASTIVGERHLSRSQDVMRVMKRTGKILVIRSGAIGDFIVTLPVIHLLRKTYSSWRLSLVAKNRLQPLVRNVVDEFADIDGPLLVPFFRDEVDRHCEEHRYLSKFDLVISYLGERGKVSENLRALGKPRVINADALPPENYDRHITEFLLAPLTEVFDVSSPPLPTITIGKEEANVAGEFLSKSGIAPSAPLVAIHPGSGSPRNVSPAGNFCRAINRIHSTFPDARLMVIEGEADETFVHAFERCLKMPCLKVRKDDLLDVAAILSRASLFIGNDSGIAHLAAAVGVPTVVAFRASNPAVWSPKGKDVWVARDASLQSIVERVAKKVVGSGDKRMA